MDSFNLPLTLTDLTDNSVIDLNCAVAISGIKAIVSLCDLGPRILNRARLFMPVNVAASLARISCYATGGYIDVAEIIEIDGIYYAIFDITNRLIHLSSGNIDLTFRLSGSAPGIQFDFTPGIAEAFVQAETREAIFLPKETISLISSLNDSFAVSVTPINSSVSVVRPLFRGLLKEEYCLVYNAFYNGTAYSSVFPLGWGMSELPEWDDDEKVLYDGEKRPIKFVPTLNNQNVLIDSMGSRICAKLMSSTVEITKIGEDGAIVFDRNSGRISSKTSFGRTTSFAYQTGRIMISDPYGNVISIRRVLNQLLISLNNGDISFSCDIYGPSQISIFEQSAGVGRGSETITYGNYGRVISVESFDGEKIELEYFSSGKIKKICKRSATGESFDSSEFSHYSDSFSITDEYGKTIAYRFDDSLETVSSFDASSGNRLFIGKRNKTDDDYVMAGDPTDLLSDDGHDFISVTGINNPNHSVGGSEGIHATIGGAAINDSEEYMLSLVVCGHAPYPSRSGANCRGVEVSVRLEYGRSGPQPLQPENIKIEADRYNVVCTSLPIKSSYQGRPLTSVSAYLIVTDEPYSTFVLFATVTRATKIKRSFIYFENEFEDLNHLRIFNPSRIIGTDGIDLVGRDIRVTQSDAVSNMYSSMNGNDIVFFDDGKYAVYGISVRYFDGQYRLSSNADFSFSSNVSSECVSVTRYVREGLRLNVESILFSRNTQDVRKNFVMLDNLGRVIREECDSSETVYRYNSSGLIESVSQIGQGSTEYYYDDSDRLISEQHSDRSLSFAVFHAYYGNYERACFSQRSGCPYEYFEFSDGYGPMSSLIRWFGTNYFTRHQDGRIASASDGNRVASFGYNHKKECIDYKI